MLITKTINSFKHAAHGIKKVFKEERNFKIHIFSGVIVLIVSVFILNFSYMELIATIFCISSVLVIEIVNTAIENSWNHLEPNHHPVVGSIKDIMAGAVMLTALSSVIVWILIIINHQY